MLLNPPDCHNQDLLAEENRIEAFARDDATATNTTDFQLPLLMEASEGAFAQRRFLGGLAKAQVLFAARAE